MPCEIAPGPSVTDDLTTIGGDPLTSVSGDPLTTAGTNPSWSLLVEMFFQPSQAVRRYGGETYGDFFYGNPATGQPEPPEWFDITRFCTNVSVSRGNTQPVVGQNTDELTVEALDPEGELYAWQGDQALSSPQFNTPVRVSIIDSSANVYVVSTGRLDDVQETYNAESAYARTVRFHAFGQKTALITSVFQAQYGLQFANERIDEVLADIGFQDPVEPYPASFFTTRLRQDTEIRLEDDAIAYKIIAQAAASCGYGMGTTADGTIRWDQIGAPLQPPDWTIAECDDVDVDAIYVSADYAAGLARVLNVVQLQNVVDPSASAEATDPLSISRWGRRSQGFGMPITVANDSQADAQAVANSILANTANIINRVADATFNTLVDARWFQLFGSLDISNIVQVSRSYPQTSSFTGEVIGVDFEIIPFTGINGTIHLSTKDETL